MSELDSMQKALAKMTNEKGELDWNIAKKMLRPEPFTARPDEPTDAELEKLGNQAMGFLVAKYGYPQSGQFVNWQARPEEIALEMAEFAYQLQSETEALRQLVAFYQGEGTHDIPEEAEYRELASIDPNSRSEKQTERLRELANVLRDNFDIESLQSQLAAERTRREEVEVLLRYSKHRNCPCTESDRCNLNCNHGLSIMSGICEWCSAEYHKALAQELKTK
jgi:hypothetical protein